MFNMSALLQQRVIFLGAIVRRCCSNYSFGPGTGSIVLDELSCNGTEPCLFKCGHAGININNCFHEEDVGVLCSGKKDLLSIIRDNTILI